MSKLFEWLSGVALITSIWFYFLTNNFILKKHDVHSWLLPIYGIIAFGIYSLSVILYRVFTFNDCKEAAEELKRQAGFCGTHYSCPTCNAMMKLTSRNDSSDGFCWRCRLDGNHICKGRPK